MGVNNKITIKKIRIEGLKRIPEDLLRDQISLKIPSKYNVKQLETAMSSAYGSKFYKTLKYNIEIEDNDHVIVIRAEEETTNRINFGIRYDSDLDAALLLNGTIRNYLGIGSKLSLDARLSETPFFKLTYLINIGWKYGFGFGTDLWYDSLDVNTYVNGETVSSYKFSEYGVRMYIQFVFLNVSALGIGGETGFRFNTVEYCRCRCP